jgi:DNA-binding response OmpR family regulator
VENCVTVVTAANTDTRQEKALSNRNLDDRDVVSDDQAVRHRLRVLVVDREPCVGDLLRQAMADQPIELCVAGSLAEARRLIGESPIDLALVEPDLPDGCGIELANEIRSRRSIAQTIVIAGDASTARAVAALRAGATDFIAKPLDIDELTQRVREAMRRHDTDRKRKQRVARLRRICRKLNDAHEQVTSQVDILCNDLVIAYQELAMQVQHVNETQLFQSLVRDELDLEQLLRKTLEHVLEKAGPTNAAVFLPTIADEFTLGGYVNYDCSSAGADLLLEHLANVVAPRFVGTDEVVLIRDNETLARTIGDDWHYLADSQVMVIPCRHRGEPLAVLALFRDADKPFDEVLGPYFEQVGPILAQHLARVVRVHHRHMPGLNDGSDYDLGEASFG